MPISQVVLDPSSNGSLFNWPVNGTCNVRLLNVQWHSSGSATTCHLIELQSDRLISPYNLQSFGNKQTAVGKYFHFLTAPHASFSVDQGFKEYNWNRLYIPGQIMLKAVDLEGSLTDNFTCILTFEIEDLP